MPLTYTGRLVRPGGTEYPSLIDIAVGLSRQPRFAGQGRRWFSVLDHTLFCDEMVQRGESALAMRKARLAVLLHDAHEAVTGDVPSDIKGDDMRRDQQVLDLVIYDAYFPGGRWKFLEEQTVGGWPRLVKRYDRRALVAEAHIVGPPVDPDKLLESFGLTDTMADDKALLVNLLTEMPIFGLGPSRHGVENHRAVQEYLSRMTELM